MGLLDWFKGKGTTKAASRKGRDRPAKARPLPEEVQKSVSADPGLDPGHLKKELESERRKNLEQERRIRKMEESLSRLQSQWMDLLRRKHRATAVAKDGNQRKEGPIEVDAKERPADIPRPTSGASTRGQNGLQNENGLSQMTSIDNGSEAFSAPILKDKTLSNFVVDDSNRFPYLASEAVATGKGRRYNPLFIYGPVGVGKTHLLQAIANRMLGSEPDLRVLYSSTEKFTDELIRSLERGDLGGFRKRYEDIDVLLVDDIQMLSGKETTQKEFFHMFNHLYNSEKQIVLCSDRPPAEIQELESRLRSRFEGGLIIDIKVPTFEGRKQILVNLAQREGFSISTEVLDYLAFYLDSSVRELEGGFNRVTAFASLMKEPITVNLVRKVLEGIIHRKELESKEGTGVPLPRIDLEDDTPTGQMEHSGRALEEEAALLERELLMEIRRDSQALSAKMVPKTSQ